MSKVGDTDIDYYNMFNLFIRGTQYLPGLPFFYFTTMDRYYYYKLAVIREIGNLQKELLYMIENGYHKKEKEIELRIHWMEEHLQYYEFKDKRL